jgi:hypothetical protein
MGKHQLPLQHLLLTVGRCVSRTRGHQFVDTWTQAVACSQHMTTALLRALSEVVVLRDWRPWNVLLHHTFTGVVITVFTTQLQALHLAVKTRQSHLAMACPLCTSPCIPHKHLTHRRTAQVL